MTDCDICISADDHKMCPVKGFISLFNVSMTFSVFSMDKISGVGQHWSVKT